MSTFRNPPLLSRMTIFGALAALFRITGAWRLVLRALANKLMSPAFRARLFSGYQPGEHDVICTVFHKSGTNWVLQMVQQIAWRGAAEFGHIHEVAPWPECPFPGVVPLDDPAQWIQSPTGLRPIKTAIESEFVPYSEAARYIHVLRDPKEVAVSSYHFVPGVLGLGGCVPLEPWLELFNGGIDNGLWPAHTAGFWAWRDRPNVLTLTFNELKRDLRGNIVKVADFMGVALSVEELDRIESRTSFHWMKENEDRFGPPLLPFVSRKKRPLMLRKGATGSSGELLTCGHQVGGGADDAGAAGAL